MTEIRIECAETGKIYYLRIDISNPSLRKLKDQVHLFTGIVPGDQILLVGPPYKQFDANALNSLIFTLSSHLSSNSTSLPSSSSSLPSSSAAEVVSSSSSGIASPTRASSSSTTTSSSTQGVAIGITTYDGSSSLLAPSSSLAVSPGGQSPKLIAQQQQQPRIFVYNRGMLSKQLNREPTAIVLPPFEVLAPQPIISETVFDFAATGTTSPLLAAVREYERIFLTNLKCGESYLLTSEQALVSCRRCIEEHQVQVDALVAAMSNLNDHFLALTESFDREEEKVVAQQAKHRELLDNFEDDLRILESIVLHPSLMNVNSMASASIASLLKHSGSSDSALSIQPWPKSESSDESRPAVFQGIGRVSLYDCLPIEKERAWASQCQEEHEKVEVKLAELKLVFEQASQRLRSFFAEDWSGLYDKAKLVSILATIEEQISIQRTSLSKIRADYEFVYNSLSGFCRGGSPLAQSEKVSRLSSLIPTLESMRASQEPEALVPMQQACSIVMEQKVSVANSKNSLSRLVHLKMRDIASLQTDIQFNLKGGIDVMKKWNKGHNEYFIHLEHVTRLPEAYESFLLEIVRRRAYNKIFDLKVMNASNEISTFRAAETKRRENFIRSEGAHLPPLFYQIVPSLKEKPPFFTPHLTDPQWLPEISIEDVQELRKIRSLSPIPVKVLRYQHRSQLDPEGKEVSSAFFKIDSLSNMDSEPDEASAGSIIFPADSLTEYGSLQATSHEELAKKFAELELQNALLLSQVVELSRQISAPNIGFPAAVADETYVAREAAVVDQAARADEAVVVNQADVADEAAIVNQPALGDHAVVVDQAAVVDESTIELGASINIPGSTGFSAHDQSQADMDWFRQSMLAMQEEASARETQLVQQEEIISTLMKKLDSSAKFDEQIDGSINDLWSAIAVTQPDAQRSSEMRESSSAAVIIEPHEQFQSAKAIMLKNIQTVAQIIKEKLAQPAVEPVPAKPTKPTIAFKDFEVGDVCLFRLTQDRKYFAAFNEGCPHRYLSEETVNLIRGDVPGGSLSSIVGKIVYMDRYISSARFNPFELSEGTEFFVVFAELMVE